MLHFQLSNWLTCLSEDSCLIVASIFAAFFAAVYNFPFRILEKQVDLNLLLTFASESLFWNPSFSTIQFDVANALGVVTVPPETVSCIS
jgi:hypothetical protein